MTIELAGEEPDPEAGHFGGGLAAQAGHEEGGEAASAAAASAAAGGGGALANALARLEASQAALRRSAVEDLKSLAEARTGNATELLRRQAAEKGAGSAAAADAAAATVADGAIIVLDVKGKTTKITLRQRAVRLPCQRGRSAACGGVRTSPPRIPFPPLLLSCAQANSFQRAFVALATKFGPAAVFSFDGRVIKATDTPISVGMCDEEPDDGDYHAQVDVGP